MEKLQKPITGVNHGANPGVTELKTYESDGRKVTELYQANTDREADESVLAALKGLLARIETRPDANTVTKIEVTFSNGWATLEPATRSHNFGKVTYDKTRPTGMGGVGAYVCDNSGNAGSDDKPLPRVVQCNECGYQFLEGSAIQCAMCFRDVHYTQPAHPRRTKWTPRSFVSQPLASDDPEYVANNMPGLPFIPGASFTFNEDDPTLEAGIFYFDTEEDAQHWVDNRMSPILNKDQVSIPRGGINHGFRVKYAGSKTTRFLGPDDDLSPGWLCNQDGEAE
jgi:hypothetical protein